MAFFDSHSSLRRALAVSLAAIVPACSAWRPAVGNPDAVIAGRPDLVRVILLQGDTLLLHQPVLLGDTIVAYTGTGLESSRTTVLLRDVQTVQVQRGTPTGQVVAVAVAVGLVALVVVALSNRGGMMGGSSGGCWIFCEGW